MAQKVIGGDLSHVKAYASNTERVRILGMHMLSRVHLSFDDFLGHLRDPYLGSVSWVMFEYSLFSSPMDSIIEKGMNCKTEFR